MARASGIVVSRLEHVDPSEQNPVYQAILLRDSPAPHVGAEVAERLRLPFSVVWRTARGLDQLQHLPRDPGVLLDRVPEIVQRLRLDLQPPFPSSLLLSSGTALPPGHALPVKPDRGGERLH